MEEDSGERDEGEQLDIGSPGTTSTRQKPMVHSDRGLMCFETRKGLSKLQSGKCSDKLFWRLYYYFICVFCILGREEVGGGFNKTIIPLTLVGCEMIIANSELLALLAIYHLMNARWYMEYLLNIYHLNALRDYHWENMKLKPQTGH